MMLKTERNSYHTRCAGVSIHVYVGVCTSIVTNLCKGQCPIVAVRGEFVSPICPSRGLAPITVTLPLLFSLAYASALGTESTLSQDRRRSLGNDLRFLEIPRRVDVPYVILRPRECKIRILESAFKNSQR